MREWVDSTLDISSNLYHTLIKPGIKTTEDSILLHYTPQVSILQSLCQAIDDIESFARLTPLLPL